MNLKTIWRVIVTGLSPRGVAGSIILPIVLVTMIGGIIAATVSTNSMSKTAAQDAERRLDNAATVMAEQMGTVQALSLRDVASMSQNPVLRSNEATPEEKLAEIKRAQNFFGTFEDITLVGLDGKVITSTNYKYYGEWGNNSLFQSAASGNPAMADKIDLSSNSVLLHIASPVMDANYTITSVLLAQVDMQYLWQVIGTVRIEKTGSLYLINGSGEIEAGPDQSRLFTKMSFVNDDNGLPPQHRLIQYKDGGNAMCALIAGVDPQVFWKGNKWNFVATLPAAEAFGAVRTVQAIFWIVIMSLLGLFVIVGLIVGHGISTKISTLARGTAEIAEGNLKYRLHVLQPRELGDLAESFNAMAARLQTSAEEIAKWNAHLEEEVEAKTNELEKAMASKVQSERLSAMGYIATSVAYELNDPLTAISLHAQLGTKDLQKAQLNEDIPQNLENASTHFKDIDKELQRSKNIITKLISFVRYSKTKEGTVNINRVIGDTLAIVSHHLKINNVEMSTQFQPDLPQVIGNAQQLQQVFLNIALNAQKAMPQGGKLMVETRQIEGRGESKVEVIFADTDGGIPAEELEKIFDPIPSTADGSQETSLDLSVSQDIIKHHGGEIKVKSEVGVGTKFVVSLPTATGSPTVDEANPGENSLKRRASDRGTGTPYPS